MAAHLDYNKLVVDFANKNPRRMALPCVLSELPVTVYSYTHAATIGMNIINIPHKLVQSMFVVSPHPEPRPSFVDLVG